MNDRIKDNEKLIFSIIYKFYKTNHIHTIERMVSSAALDFDDLVQLGRIAYMKAINNHDGRNGFNSYFYKIFHNKLAEIYRSQNQAKNLVNLVSLDDENTLADVVHGNSNTESEVLASIMCDNLTKRDKRIMVMYIEGYEATNIGKKLGCSRRHVYNHLERIREELRNEITQL